MGTTLTSACRTWTVTLLRYETRIRSRVYIDWTNTTRIVPSSGFRLVFLDVLPRCLDSGQFVKVEESFFHANQWVIAIFLLGENYIRISWRHTWRRANGDRLHGRHSSPKSTELVETEPNLPHLRCTLLFNHFKWLCQCPCSRDAASRVLTWAHFTTPWSHVWRIGDWFVFCSLMGSSQKWIKDQDGWVPS